MDTFRSEYESKCAELGIDASYAILDKLSLKKVNGEEEQHKFPETLDLSGTSLNIKTIAALAAPLQSSPVFTRLILSDAFLGDDGAILIANALKTNSSIQVLDLRGNNIRADGAMAIAGMVKVNNTLKSLSLEWNCIGIWDNGIKAISDAISVNQTLEELDLRNNKVGPQGAQTLALSLKHNTSLKKLDLRWNNAGVIGGRAFVDTLKWNTTLLELDLTGNEIPEDVSRALDAALARNRSQHMQSLHQKVRDTHLNATIQALTQQHHETLKSLQTKLSSSDTQVVDLGKRLSKASDEIMRTQEGYKVLEVKLERVMKEKELVEDLLLRERKDGAGRVKELEKEVERERERRLAAEETQRNVTAELTKRALEFESQARDADIKLELLRRDKKTLLEELEQAKDREARMARAWEEKQAQMESAFQRKLNALSDSKDKELSEKNHLLEQRIRGLEAQKQTLETEVDSQRSKYMIQKRDWEEKMIENEKRLLGEEASKRELLQTQVKAMETKLATHNQLLLDHEKQVTALVDAKTTLTTENAALRSEKNNLICQLNSALQRLDDAEKRLSTIRQNDAEVAESRTREKTLQDVIRTLRNDLDEREERILLLETLVGRLRVDVKRYRDEIDNHREVESMKMQELESALGAVMGRRRKVAGDAKLQSTERIDSTPMTKTV